MGPEFVSIQWDEVEHGELYTRDEVEQDFTRYERRTQQ